MVLDYGSSGNSSYAKLPKKGEKPQEYHIKDAQRIDNPNYKFNFMKREEMVINGQKVMVEKNQGFRYEFTLMDGKILTISSWKPFYAFKNANVQPGDKISVSHPKEGEWKVDVIERGPNYQAWDDK